MTLLLLPADTLLARVGSWAEDNAIRQVTERQQAKFKTVQPTAKVCILSRAVDQDPHLFFLLDLDLGDTMKIRTETMHGNN